MSNPLAVVALPTWRQQHIIWLQLESLSRQKTRYPWELVVSACDFGESERIVSMYAGNLSKAGCVGITRDTHHGGRRTLGEKWVKIAQLSKAPVFLLCASDNYSYPERIEESVTTVMDGAEWFDVGSGLFYNIATGETAQWKREYGQTGLFMATRTELIADLDPKDAPKKGIDAWIAQSFGGIKRKEVEAHRNGLHTDGANTISQKRQLKYKDKDYSRNFHVAEQKVDRILPPEVRRRLVQMR